MVLFLFSIMIRAWIFSLCVVAVRAAYQLPDLDLRVHGTYRNDLEMVDPVIDRAYTAIMSKYYDRSYLLRNLTESDYHEAIRPTLDRLAAEINTRLVDVRSRAKSTQFAVYSLLARRHLFASQIHRSDLVFVNPDKLVERCLEPEEPAHVMSFLKSNIDVECISVLKKLRFLDPRSCHLPSVCVNVKLYSYKDLYFCVGARASNMETLMVADQSKSQRLSTYSLPHPFVLLCNKTDDTMHVFIDVFYNNITTYDPSMAVVSYQYPFITVSDFGYESLLKMFRSRFISIPIAVRSYSYVCDDSLFALTKYVDNVNVFMSPRGCRRFINVGSVTNAGVWFNYLCVDYLYDTMAESRCPDDWRPSRNVTQVMRLVTLAVDQPRDDYWTFSEYILQQFTKNLFDNILQVNLLGFSSFLQHFTTFMSQIVSVLSTFIDRISSFHFLDNFRLLVDYFFESFNKFLGYSSPFDLRQFARYAALEFFSVMLSNSTHDIRVSPDSNLVGFDVGKWLADALTAILTPFWHVFLSILSEAMNIILNLLFDLAPLLTMLVQKLEASLENLLDALLALFVTVAKLVLHLLVHLDKSIHLSEYLVLYLILSYYLRSSLTALLSLILSVLVLGLKRRFPSLFLLLLNQEFRSDFNDTSLYYFAYANYLSFYELPHNSTHTVLVVSSLYPNYTFVVYLNARSIIQVLYQHYHQFSFVTFLDNVLFHLYHQNLTISFQQLLDDYYLAYM